MNVLAFSLPIPPSVNAMFATDFKTRRRFMTKDYSSWRADARNLINLAWQAAGYPMFEKHLSLTIHVGLNYTGDVSNRIKGIEDAIGEAIPGFPDDRYYDRVEIQRVPGIEGARVMIQQLAPPQKEAA